jgi:hypothetical protein
MQIKKHLCSIICLILISSSVCGQDDFVIRKGSDSYYIKGQLKSCYLKEDALVDGFSCTKWIHYYEDGNLRRITISEPDTFNGRFYPAKSTLFFSDDQKVEKCWFGKKVTLEGLPIYGGYKDLTITFYEDGKIHCGFLSKNAIVQGITAQKGIASPLFFYPSGKLKRCTVGKKIEIQNLLLKAGMIIDLDEEGRIISTTE